METFELKEVQSGEDAGCLWVTLGFSSKLRKFDVLHVVCGKDNAPESISADTGLYFERFDQAHSCCGRATSIGVRTTTVRIDLSPAETRALGFRGPVTFVNCAKVTGFEKAITVFRAFAQHSRGKNVIVRTHSKNLDRRASSGRVAVGANPYQYVVDYQEDVQAALDNLRQDVFRSGQYYGADRGAKTPDEALERAGEAGTRSILDIRRITEKPDYFCAARVHGADLIRYFGTDKPTLAMVENCEAFWMDIERGMARCVVIYEAGVPRKLFFAGYSFD
ncbi:MAG: hypothetical protein L0387_00390 [Acidobacteria bacterium]|nr:hypothetical protein [Acidobacteriota bacterium]MCI0718703.1 hypothetical protein [Acidobacteriota bacterium]